MQFVTVLADTPKTSYCWENMDICRIEKMRQVI